MAVSTCSGESKKLVAECHLVNNGYYSYNSLSTEEDPVKQWIGREVKRFLAEAHVHLPFLLRVASAPVDVVHAAASAEDDGVYDPESDDEYAPLQVLRR